MRENIFAYTPPGADMPPYISINHEENGNVSVTVRSSKDLGSATGYIELSKEEWRNLLREATTHTAQQVRVEREKPQVA